MEITDNTTKDQVADGRFNNDPHPTLLDPDTKRPYGAPHNAPQKALQGGPRRSWVRGGEEGAYDYKFQVKDDDDGGRVITVLCKYATDPEQIGKEQRKLLSSAFEIQKLATDFDEVLKSEDVATLSQEHLEEAQSVILAANARQAEAQSEFARYLVSDCVIGWRGAPIQYSDAARDNLPDDICAEWMPFIIKNNVITEKEARFLPPDLKSGESGAQSPGTATSP